jgi:hypothetical protein
MLPPAPLEASLHHVLNPLAPRSHTKERIYLANSEGIFPLLLVNVGRHVLFVCVMVCM